MAVLYVTEQGAEVRAERARLVVRKGKSRLADVRLDDCDQVVVMGQVQVSTQAVRAALSHGVEVLYMTRGGRFLGRLSNGLAKNVERRLSQFRCLSVEDARLDLAKSCVFGKVMNMRALLRRHQSRLHHDRIALALGRMRNVKQSLSEAASLDQVRGVEGYASKEYFAAFRHLVRADGFEFDGRKRRPPPDPVNVLLSFGYTLLAGAIHGIVEQSGLDPFVGALHDPAYGRPSAVLDLMEEFRPVVVDSTVLRVVNTRAMIPGDFVWPDHVEEEEAPVEGNHADGEGEEPIRRRPVVLTTLGVRKWVTAFERRLSDMVEYPRLGVRLAYRRVLREQVYMLARHYTEGEPYEAFRYRA